MHRDQHTYRQRLGARGEAVAAKYLLDQGYTILARNWRTREGELDLVAQDRGELVAVEVKTRSGTGCGSPLTAITPVKSARLRRLLLAWVRHERPRASGLRIDAIGVTLRANERPRIDHLQGIS